MKRNDRMLMVVAAAVIVIGLLFYMVWNNQLEQRVRDDMNANPVFQTTGTLQTQIAVPK